MRHRSFSVAAFAHALAALAVTSAHGAVVADYRFEGTPGTALSTLVATVGPAGSVGTRAPALKFSNSLASPDAGSSSLDARGDGGYAFVTSANAAALRPAGSFTLECYVNPSLPYTGSNADGDNIISMKNAESGNSILSYGLGYNSSTRQFYALLDTDISTNTGLVALAAPAITPNAWYHLALVFADNGVTDTATLYVNGVAQATSAGNYPIAYNSALAIPFVIGAANFNSDTDPFRRNFDGLIDEVRLSDQALTPAQFLAVPGFVPEPGALAPLLATAAILRRRR